MDFITVDERNKLDLDQIVFSALVTGDSSEWFGLQAGPFAFAFGGDVGVAVNLRSGTRS